MSRKRLLPRSKPFQVAKPMLRREARIPRPIAHIRQGTARSANLRMKQNLRWIGCPIVPARGIRRRVDKRVAQSESRNFERTCWPIPGQRRRWPRLLNCRPAGANFLERRGRLRTGTAGGLRSCFVALWSCTFGHYGNGHGNGNQEENENDYRPSQHLAPPHPFSSIRILACFGGSLFLALTGELATALADELAAIDAEVAALDGLASAVAPTRATSGAQPQPALARRTRCRSMRLCTNFSKARP